MQTETNPTDTLSIVIPITKMAGKLDNLKKSLFSIPQSKNVEVVLVHDIQDQATQYELERLLIEFNHINIKLIQGYFGNPGSSRNAGVRESTAKWITFWDSDDVGNATPILEDMLMARQRTKLIVGQYRQYDVMKKKYLITPRTEMLTDLPNGPGLWRLIFLRETLVPFDELSMGEDQVFIVKNFPSEDTISFSEKEYYTYYIGSTTQLTRDKSKISDLLKTFNLTLKVAENQESKIRKLVAEFALRQLLTVIKKGSSQDRIRCIGLIFKFIIEIRPVAVCSTIVTIVLGTVRSKKQKINYVFLTGGLGNQLFQLCAASKISGGRKVSLVTNLGPIRKSSSGAPDIFSFDISNIGVPAMVKTPNAITKKAAGYCLRMGIKPNRYQKYRLLYSTIIKLTELLLSCYTHNRIELILGKGVGYFETKKTKRSSMQIGYFQSYRWLEDPSTKNKFRNLTLLEISPEYDRFRNLAQGKNILAIHIRLGDYKYESKFGILAPKYYEFALQTMRNEASFDEIWVFSDEPHLAKEKYLNSLELHNSKINWIDGTSMSSAENLEVMRLCSAYIIANSSFSWWGAQLSRNPNPKVIAPSKWFKDMETPIDLFPSSWMLIKPIFL